MSIVRALDLTIDDRDPQAVFDAMASRWAELMPDAILRTGSPETVLMEAVATAGADLIYAANRIPDIILEGIFTQLGVPRDAGATAVGSVTITLDGAQDGTISEGTAMTANGLDLVVATATDFEEATSVVVQVACRDRGAAGNDLTVGTDVNLDDPIPYAVSAEVTTAFTGGSDTESDAAYLARVGNVFARLTSSLVKPVHFSAFMLQDSRVGASTGIDFWDGDLDATIGTDIGHITVVAHGRAGTLSSEILADLRSQMQAIASSAVSIHARAATITTQPIALTIHPITGAVSSEVVSAVQAALSTWLAPLAWTFGETIRVNEIIAIAAAVPGVDYVSTVTTPAADVSLAAYALAQAGTITVTVA